MAVSFDPRPEDRPKLPCYPCPHLSSCCAYGATLSPREAKAIARRFGKDRIYLTRWGEWRTRVKNKRCVFLSDNSCTLHSSDVYPGTCRGFPWTLADGTTPYPYPKNICGEIRLIESRALVRTSRRSR